MYKRQVNDNIMICLAAYVDEDGSRARQQMIAARPNYLTSNVFRYHDTFPHPKGCLLYTSRCV